MIYYFITGAESNEWKCDKKSEVDLCGVGERGENGYHPCTLVLCLINGRSRLLWINRGAADMWICIRMSRHCLHRGSDPRFFSWSKINNNKNNCIRLLQQKKKNRIRLFVRFIVVKNGSIKPECEHRISISQNNVFISDIRFYFFSWKNIYTTFGWRVILLNPKRGEDKNIAHIYIYIGMEV